jgi:hypothetical protein
MTRQAVDEPDELPGKVKQKFSKRIVLGFGRSSSKTISERNKTQDQGTSMAL